MLRLRRRLKRRICLGLTIFIIINLIAFGSPRNKLQEYFAQLVEEDEDNKFWYGDDPPASSVADKEEVPQTPDVPRAYREEDEPRGWEERVSTRSEKKRKKSSNTKKPLERHKYRSDGLMEVNPDAPHPIYDLIKRAEKQWEDKQDRASTTLKDAVKEYRRRHNRWPPKGFDKWWNYVQENQVQLPDEYDQIFHDISPYLGMRAKNVRKQQIAWEKHPNTFTLVSKQGKVALHHHTMKAENIAIGRANDQLHLLRPVQQWLPDFRATFAGDDVPNQFVDYNLKTDASEMAALGTFVDTGVKYERHHGWEAACPPGDPIWSYDRKVNLTELWHKPKTFVWDHKASMDPCMHPSHVRLNGFLEAHDIGPVSSDALVPAFSMCTSQLHSDILTVAVEYWTEDIGADPDWKDKCDDRLLWRGSNTGIHFGPNMNWNISQRARLVTTTNEFGGYTDVLRSTADPTSPVGKPEKLHKGMLNGALMDIHFAGEPLQCEGETCDDLWKRFEWKQLQSFEDAWKYKYILDIDGNGWSARFKRLMTSKSLILKSTIFPEWYTDRIQPWVHYIPIKNDLTDLYDVLAFFRGDFRGHGAHEDLAEKIASSGREWSFSYWRQEDLVAYTFRLFLEYARVYALDREEMDFTLDDVEKIQDQKSVLKEAEDKIEKPRAAQQKTQPEEQELEKTEGGSDSNAEGQEDAVPDRNRDGDEVGDEVEVEVDGEAENEDEVGTGVEDEDENDG